LRSRLLGPHTHLETWLRWLTPSRSIFPGAATARRAGISHASPAVSSAPPIAPRRSGVRRQPGTRAAYAPDRPSSGHWRWLRRWRVQVCARPGCRPPGRRNPQVHPFRSCAQPFSALAEVLLAMRRPHGAERSGGVTHLGVGVPYPASWPTRRP
jgi:hypothetical protein